MLNATVFLTLATITGLVAGFAREWLLIDAWGAGARSDAFMVAVFLPEAIRMTLATGMLSAAALPLFTKMDVNRHTGWLQNQSIFFTIIGCCLAFVLVMIAPACIYLIGPGLDEMQHNNAVESLKILIWVLPGLFLQALLCVPHQSEHRFVRAGLGSLLFNLPIVLYLFLEGKNSNETGIGYAFIIGSILMTLVLIPNLPKQKTKLQVDISNFWLVFKKDILELNKLLAPLLLSSSASQGLALLERMVASYMGEGAVTLVNLARKLINIPLVALMSLNQVLLSKMSKQHHSSRILVLKQGLNITTVITLSAAVGFICSSTALVDLLLPKGLSDTALPLLLAWMATTIVFASWNALLARYQYAAGDTKTPLRYELTGSAVNAVGLVAFTQVFGLIGIPMAALIGILVTGVLLFIKIPKSSISMMKVYSVCGAILLVSFTFIYPSEFFISSPITRVLFAAVISTFCFLMFLIWLKPWKES